MISQLLGFRPLDGESISKHYCVELDIDPDTSESFRPLDGESISKLLLIEWLWVEILDVSVP